MRCSTPFSNGSRSKLHNTAAPSPKTFTIISEPNAIVWIDEIRRGVTDASGKLTLQNVSPARHSLRVRANGFKESTVAILPGKRSATVKLVPTTDAAELAFQEAETLRERAKDDESRQRSVEAYRRALKLRPAFPAVRVGLARLLLDLRDTTGALAEIEAARRLRPIFPEASAVEGGDIERQRWMMMRSIFSALHRERAAFARGHVGLARALE